MIARYLIKCADIPRPDWPPIPVRVPCGSPLTLGVIGLPSSALGVKITGCRIRITNADGVAVSKDCRLVDGAWCATFPASHFQGYGAVKKGLIVFAVGKDETGADQLWILRTGDVRIDPVDASSRPGTPSEQPGGDVFRKSDVIDGVQHYKLEKLVYSEEQNAYGLEWYGDYVIIGGEFVPFSVEG